MTLYIIIVISLSFNIFLLWYLKSVLSKLLFISENIGDLFLLCKSFNVFLKSLYSMESYNGEPIIQELFFKIQEMIMEIEAFRAIFEVMLDEELEEELDAQTEPAPEFQEG
tara:strand:- start:495 stop:827 length:333 start_codon:yes stop_codon:yes gene_type:complete